jgi:hypothetical protein
MSQSDTAMEDGVIRALYALGNGNACTDFGAIEGASMLLREGLDKIADGLLAVAEAIASRDATERTH